MRGSNLLRIIPLVGAASYWMGCATSLAFATGGMVPECANGDPYMFIGTSLDVRIVANSKELTLSGRAPFHWTLRVLAAIDTPLSLAADTVTLPITGALQIVEAIGCSMAPSDEKPIIKKSGEDVQVEGSN